MSGRNGQDTNDSVQLNDTTTMKRMTFSLAALLCIAAVSCSHRDDSLPKISIFCDHIETIARQERISFAEAATRVREFGYTGADIRVTQKPEEIETLDSLGFAHACAISEIDYSREGTEELEDRTLAFMEERGFDQLLLITGLMPEGGLTKDERDAARQRVASFAKRVADHGYRIMVEDFDNVRSLCYNAELIDSLFAVSSDLGLVFDTGNFQFAGQDAMEQYEHFRPRIGHVHLKDRTSPTDMRCVAVGTGCIPIVEIIHKLLDSGYKGWFTYEEYGTRTMLEDCEASYRNISAALTE